MSERLFLFLVGVFILLSLYLGSDVMIFGLCGLLFFEGVTDIRLTTLTQKLRKQSLESGLASFNTTQRFSLDGLRVWRIMVAIILLMSYVGLHELGYNVIWFFPWFMGFAILGAGASGMCPMLMLVRWVGFR